MWAPNHFLSKRLVGRVTGPGLLWSPLCSQGPGWHSLGTNANRRADIYLLLPLGSVALNLCLLRAS